MSRAASIGEGGVVGCRAATTRSRRCKGRRSQCALCAAPMAEQFEESMPHWWQRQSILQGRGRLEVGGTEQTARRGDRAAPGPPSIQSAMMPLVRVEVSTCSVNILWHGAPRIKDSSLVEGIRPRRRMAAATRARPSPIRRARVRQMEPSARLPRHRCSSPGTALSCLEPGDEPRRGIEPRGRKGKKKQKQKTGGWFRVELAKLPPPARIALPTSLVHGPAPRVGPRDTRSDASLCGYGYWAGRKKMRIVV